MKKIIFLLAMTSLIACSKKKFEYPETRKDETVDNYFGTRVPDPFRWLEDDMSDETAAWVKAQNEVTFSYLESIPFRDALKERMTEIWNYPKMSTPFKEGDLYFYSYNTGLQNQSIIYMKKSLEDEGEVFLDPNGFSDDGTVAL
ncbi:MAG: S9 family peptidase, partial [Bacteroidales bacterium]|nr:S9 family peptidase [Bacteroidales bacterium]